MWSQRGVVADGLARQAVVHSPRTGPTTPGDVRDTQPCLLRAAPHIGESTERLCPVCRRRNIPHLTYADGGSPRSHADQAERAPQVADMAQDYEEFRAYMVEVCQGCSWNRLTASFVLGNGPPTAISLY